MIIDVDNFIEKCEKKISPLVNKLEKRAEINTKKVLDVFKENNISLRHFSGTTGYGYNDIGRDTLCKVFAKCLGAEDAIVSPYISCGSHALSIALMGLLYKKGMKMLSITGKPYDTLDDVIFGAKDEDNSSFRDIGVEYYQVDLKNNDFDLEKIKSSLLEIKPNLVFIQRSKGYLWRNSLTIDEIKNIISYVRSIDKTALIMVDNCYGEFTDVLEPTAVGANVIAGSLIKNLGAGLVPTGGYIAGDKNVIKRISYRFSSPSLGLELGSYEPGYRLFYEGLFLAPHTVLQATKGCLLISEVFRQLGYEVMPGEGELPTDIVTEVKLNDRQLLIDICRLIQSNSPVDSFVTPEASDFPGYNDQIIMAAGAFVDGSSLELSCDAPVKPPYTLYIQGGLTYEHVKIAIKTVVEKLFSK